MAMCINPPIRGSIVEPSHSGEGVGNDCCYRYQSPYKGFNRGLRKS